jgi:general secretion pathway protein L
LAKHVIIHLPNVGDDYAQWVVADDQGALSTGLTEGTLSDAAEAVHGHRSTLVLPGNDVLLAEATVPGGNTARALQAVPFVLEEQLADDVDTLHFALGTKGKDDRYPVAVVGRDTMNLVTEQCVEAGLRPGAIVPETLALPKFDADTVGEVSWTALVDDSHTVVRLNGYKGFATDADMAGFMLDGAQHDLPEDASASMVVYRTDSGVALPDVPRVDVENRSCDNRLTLYARGLANSPSINLLQGGYSPKTQFNKVWKPWRWTAVLALVLGAIFIAG